eukprot:TRINITY_DN6761_c0_g1_i3.p1 TRINITY_DN6761_c0_g1~~TRINITY_DN6761_c0_g1_i3.p1  ORF type:complete len:862 (+),score=233.78 TRINITY_DN6761_c0_g1_i3:101-2587(+)
MPSIKVLNIALVLLCIVITAFICTFLAISSSDTALDDTKASRDTSVNSSFTVGEDSVRKRTDEYLDLLMNSTVDYLLQFMEPQRQTALGMAEEVMARPYDEVKNFSFYNFARYYWGYRGILEKGNTGLGIFFYNYVSVFYYENYQTLRRGPDEYHDHVITFNYGIGHPWGGPGRTVIAAIHNRTGDPLFYNDPATDVLWDWTMCNYTSVPTNGTVPDRPCQSDFDGIESFGGLANNFPVDTASMTPPISFGTYLASSTFVPITHNGVRTGVVFAGADLRHISTFLQNIKIGGPVDVYPSRGRLYITVRGSNMGPDPIGMLVATSRGTVSGSNEDGISLIPPVNCSDLIISSVARELLSQEVTPELTAQDQTSVILNISTDYAPDGEDFYYRVGIMNNGHGIDWYVHIVIDRAYILGEIDRKLEETRVSISDAERKVDDDLKKARTVLYVLVVAVAVLLTVVSIVFVLKIIEPLLILEYEMAMVAVMDLEKVDRERPLSTLQEVQLMQVSFFQMINNLVEFRNYMPASVLQATSDESDSTQAQSTDHSRSGATQSRVSRTSHSLRVAQKQNVLYGTEAKTKKVTLLACNMRSFLQSGEFLKKISEYLTAALLHVKATRGTPDSFSGDRLYVSWNGVRNCSSYRAAAYNFSRALTGNTSLGRFSIGIASGQVRCGNMGCDGMKKFTFVGSLASWVHIVERVARMQGADIAVDNTTHEEVTNVAFTRPLLHLSFPKHSDKTLLVHEALGEKEVKEEEWMYQMAEGDANDPHTKYAASYKLFMDGNVEGAGKALEGYADSSEVVKKYREQLCCAAANPSICEPYGTRHMLIG